MENLLMAYVTHNTRKGILLEAEGAEIHFRNLKIMELPPGVISSEQIVPELENPSFSNQ